VYFSAIDKGNQPNMDYFAAFFVLSASGLAVSFALHVLVMTCWLKNASEPSQPPFAKKLNLRIAVRWFILPFITFGMILGVCYATLVYGFPSPSHLESASKIRLAAGWGVFINATLVICFLSMLVYYSYTSHRRGGKRPEIEQDRLLRVSLYCCLLLWIAVLFSLLAIYYHKKFALDPNYYYPLIVLPGLIEQIIVTIPLRLVARIGLGSGYDAFCKDRDELKTEKHLGGVLNVFKTFRVRKGEILNNSSGSLTGSSGGIKEESIV
jgi:hypothetical protein